MAFCCSPCCSPCCFHCCSPCCSRYHSCCHFYSLPTMCLIVVLVVVLIVVAILAVLIHSFHHQRVLDKERPSPCVGRCARSCCHCRYLNSFLVIFSECWTKNDPHLVEDDVPRCQTVQEEKCVEVKLMFD